MLYFQLCRFRYRFLCLKVDYYFGFLGVYNVNGLHCARKIKFNPLVCTH